MPRTCCTASKARPPFGACHRCCLGRGEAQDEMCMPVRTAKICANHAVMRLPPGTRIDCVSKLILASLSVVCRNALLTLRWDLAASPTAFRARVGASLAYSAAKADASTSGLWQMHSSRRTAYLMVSCPCVLTTAAHFQARSPVLRSIAVSQCRNGVRLLMADG